MSSTKPFPSTPNFLRALVLAISLLLSASLLASCSSKDESTPTESAAAGCEPATATAREVSSVGAPQEFLKGERYTLTLSTNCGDIEIAADAKNAPATVSAIGFLANAKYFDNTLCHRLTTSGIFVLQCGDPTASGSGGPGFTFPDENLPDASGVNYPKGTVAMANSGPNTNGSQFFLVYADTILGPNYTIWGEITKGLDILENIAAAGTSDGGPDGAPKNPVEIRSAKLQ